MPYSIIKIKLSKTLFFSRCIWVQVYVVHFLCNIWGSNFMLFLTLTLKCLFHDNVHQAWSSSKECIKILYRTNIFTPYNTEQVIVISQFVHLLTATEVCVLNDNQTHFLSLYRATYLRLHACRLVNILLQVWGHSY